jgi:hypothetical protein
MLPIKQALNRRAEICEGLAITEQQLLSWVARIWPWTGVERHIQRVKREDKKKPAPGYAPHVVIQADHISPYRIESVVDRCLLVTMKRFALLASVLSFLAAHAGFAPNPMFVQQDDGSAYPFDFDTHGEPITNCTTDQRNDIITHHFSYMELHNYVGNISAIYTLGVGTVLDDESRGYPRARSSLKIYVGLDEVFSQDTLFRNGTIEKTMHWGAYVEGARTSTVRVANNGSVNGTIDGRGFWVKDNKTMIFLDGGSPPTLILPTNLKPLLSSFLERTSSALKSCANNTAPDMPSSAMPAHDGFEIALDRSQDPGHQSNTFSATHCVLCITLWVIWWGGLDAACSGLTCAWTFGLGCVLCAAAVGPSLAATIIDDCLTSDECCPKRCGSGLVSACCWSGEKCLNSSRGLCCPGAKKPCLGKTCCSSSQTCIERGPDAGTCCPTAALCNGVCCKNDVDTCVSNKCCTTGQCGAKCCNPDPESTFFWSYCANSLRGVCCPEGEVEIGTTGFCCPPGQERVDGICCSPGSTTCRGICCRGRCRNGECVFYIEDEDCKRQGFPWGACLDHYPSGDCPHCAHGCCTF